MIWLNRNTSSPCQIILEIEPDVQVHARVLGRNRYTLDVFKRSRPFKQNPIGEEEKRTLTELLGLRALLVPPIGGTSPGETFMAKPQMVSEIQQGRIAETFRNTLFWLYNDGRKEQFQQVVDLVNRYIPSLDYSPHG